MRTRVRLRGASAMLLVALLGCGDDASTESSGEPCDEPGTSQACNCESGLRGKRTCLNSEVWSDCMCSSTVKGPCVPGQPSQCGPCPGQIGDRPSVCTKEGNFDCSCPPTGGVDGGGDGGGDAETPPPTDAGKDSGSQDDAGDGDGG